MTPHESDNKFLVLAETMSDGVLVMSGSGSFLHANCHAAALLDYSVGSLLRCALGDVLHSPDSDSAGRLSGIMVGKAVVTRYQTSMVRADGTVLPVEVSGSPITWSDQPAVLVVFRDISERKRSEEELRVAVKRLETTGREMELFGHSLSHDLKAPLSTIYCAAQALRELHGELLDEMGKTFLDGICSASERMDALIDAMFMLSRISCSDLRLDETDLSVIGMQILLRLRMEDPREVELVVTPGMKVIGDPLLLKSALEHLLGNAWKYSRNAAQPRIEFGCCPGIAPTFFVRDNGAGFDMKHADKLFLPFGRLHADEQFEGGGIGLAVVKRIMERHGGTVSGEGEPGKGATFSFTLPAAVAPAPQ